MQQNQDDQRGAESANCYLCAPRLYFVCFQALPLGRKPSN